MKITITAYRPVDKPELIRLMEILKDYLASIDPLHRNRRLPEYGELYTAGLLKKIKATSGVIYLAKHEQAVVGCITGNIEELNAKQCSGSAGVKTGRVLELIVREEWRGQGVGKMLIQKMEAYFQSKSCDIIRVEVFVPNTGAHGFYDRLSYHDRVVDMIKLI
jgi:ribosomal protein S18 acetylase RimI-like enzyme